jgi:hypothetical protein
MHVRAQMRAGVHGTSAQYNSPINTRVGVRNTRATRPFTQPAHNKNCLAADWLTIQTIYHTRAKWMQTDIYTGVRANRWQPVCSHLFAWCRRFLVRQRVRAANALSPAARELITHAKPLTKSRGVWINQTRVRHRDDTIVPNCRAIQHFIGLLRHAACCRIVYY